MTSTQRKWIGIGLLFLSPFVGPVIMGIGFTGLMGALLGSVLTWAGGYIFAMEPANKGVKR